MFRFNIDFLIWTLPSLNLDESIISKQGCRVDKTLTQNAKQYSGKMEKANSDILMRRLVTCRLIRIYTVCKTYFPAFRVERVKGNGYNFTQNCFVLS